MADKLFLKGMEQSGWSFDMSGRKSLKIGRGQWCSVVLSGDEVSRTHCLVEPGAEGYRIRDLKSRNGTFINSQRIMEGNLLPGDVLKIGRWELVLHREDALPSMPPHDAGETLSLSPDDSHYLHSNGIGSRAAKEEKTRLGLGELYTLALEIVEKDTPLQLMKTALKRIGIYTRADASLLVHVGDNKSPPTILYHWPNKMVEKNIITWTLIRAVLQNELGMHLADPVEDARLGSIDSLEPGTLSSALCCPIPPDLSKEKALYLVRLSGHGKFNQEDLEWVLAAATIVGKRLNDLNKFDVSQRESQRLQHAVLQPLPIIGGPRIQKITKQAERVAQSDLPILITGPSGSGKELIARYVHAKSWRSQRQLVCIHCPAISETLIESELFGIEEKVATGVSARKGLLEQANEGTLFLDEVADLPLPVQAALLRALDGYPFKRVGGRKGIISDFRVVAATCKNLLDEISSGRFREDLYYRLSGLIIEMPPLTQRREDIPLLALHYLEQCSQKSGWENMSFSPEVMRVLKENPWPGNVRDLKQTIQRAVVLAKSPIIAVDDLQLDPETPKETEEDTLEAVTHKHVLTVLQRENGNRVRTAKRLGIAISTLYRYLKSDGSM